MDYALIARVCHEVNRAYCQSLGDHSQVPWEAAPQWQKDSAEAGVRFFVDTPTATPEMMHESWRKTKRLEGWKFGPVKDAQAKTHPCMVDYADLPKSQRVKDDLFLAVCRSMMAGV